MPIPDSKGPSIPRHIAIVMDGNGRWARARLLPRTEGHRRGVKTVRSIIAACLDRGIRILTVFAFSSENWRRPRDEVSTLMELFLSSLRREREQLHHKGVRIRFIGDRNAFSERLQAEMVSAEQYTQDNREMTLVIAANYGGRWDIEQAARRYAAACVSTGRTVDEIAGDPAPLEAYMATYDLCEPDLFIRTGGERRLSNFLLWQLAYTELYFTDTLWPDFDAAALDVAIDDFLKRQRRFGQTSEQIGDANG
ncbi:polyprenyl diphosphate synthase [Acidihalobacter ferrooxydans]|uniref:polyprenyl diphosphate synthase n=1 Tax=Acidihalobacter ferrooxydans TaxID=1765967 RepID=UPI00214FDBFC|nr:polyprenyl diphosphate synthase [Acidihalobacter ferrooxydans]